MPAFNPQNKTALDALWLAYPQVRAGKMFGFPAYFVGRKLCACVYEDGLGLKLPAGTIARLLESDPHAAPFQPFGRQKMREWVQITVPAPQDFTAYLAYFEESIQYVMQAAH